MKSVLTKTMFVDSLKNEQILNRLTEQYEKDPETIARKKAAIEREAIYNARVLSVEAFEKWVDALRSGKYRQKGWTRASDKGRIITLKNRGTNHFSVLGVLLEVNKDLLGGEWHAGWFVKQGLSFEDWTRDGNSNLYLPPFVEEILGIKDVESDLIPRGNINELARMNTYMNFKQIADIIQSEYLNNQ